MNELIAVEIFLALAIGHFVADYPLQGDFLAKAKNCTTPIPGISWRWAMTAHCAIHAGMVWIITGSVFIGATEFIWHFYMDKVKCDGEVCFNTDQWFHIACKVLFAVVMYAYGMQPWWI